jgi:hypothetical protein
MGILENRGATLKLVVPYLHELRTIEARMLRLAEFLGVPCEGLALAKGSNCVAFLKDALPNPSSCIAVNPQTMRNWVGENGIPSELVAFLASRFKHILVYGLRVDAFDNKLVRTLSQQALTSVEQIKEDGHSYTIAENSKDICEAFSGLSFGPVNRGNDHILSVGGSDKAVRRLISIGGQPMMAATRLEDAEVLFVASEDVADLNEEVGEAPTAGYFSRLLSHAMALRYVAGGECWRANQPRACVIIDDPLLRKNYGFLNFDSLLRLADEHKFHATIAFIPHNFRRNSARIIRLFRENAARLSICFHGNDHTEAEFASTDAAHLQTMLRIAEDRMETHQRRTGLSCDKVMVFPQGKFSTEAMEALRLHDFCAAVNTVPHPSGMQTRLTIGELAQPAVLRYGGFPLFVRKPIRKTQREDIAFNLFFGRSILIVEHHEVFQHPESLIEVAERINTISPEMHWSNLAAIASNSTVERQDQDGTYHVRAYSGVVDIANDSNSTRHYSIEWDASHECSSIAQVLLDGMSVDGYVKDEAGIRLSLDLDPGSSRTVSLVHKSVPIAIKGLGLRWNIQAFLRRRLSELRDNYLSKNQQLLLAAKSFQRRFLKV